MKIYYAHPMAYYGTHLELMDIVMLSKIGTVVNPNTPKYQIFTNMKQFEDLAASCDMVAYRPFVDGKIGAGVAKEIQAALKAGKIVLELPHKINERILTREETRARIGKTL